MDKQQKISVAFPLYQGSSSGSYIRGIDYTRVDHPNVDIMEYGGTTAVKNKIKAKLFKLLDEGLRAVKNTSYRRAIGTFDGTVLFISWRYDSWQYDIAGPGRKGIATSGGGYKTFDIATEAATQHANDSYGGVAWTC